MTRRVCQDCKGPCHKEARRCRPCYRKAQTWMAPPRDALSEMPVRPLKPMYRPGRLKTGSELLASLWNRRPGPDPPRPARYSP